jgi:hypothetical protein
MKIKWAMIGATALLLNACVVEPGRVRVDVPVPGIVVSTTDPYYYSPAYCAGCWYGQWGGRIGYHRGGGRPWERQHFETDHHGEDRGRDVRHEGHR